MENSNKNVAVNAAQSDLITEALKSSENAKLDLFRSIVGGGDGDGDGEFGCSVEKGVLYSDTTFVRHD